MDMRNERGRMMRWDMRMDMRWEYKYIFLVLGKKILREKRLKD
jgi:hypothetical protein